VNFKQHLELVGEHAYLSASKYHWINYDEEKLYNSYKKFSAIQKGTELHDFASHCIRLNQKLPKSKKSLNEYVNDAIGFRMKSEQPLFYSINSFGTADAISFKEKERLLRIHDLKTGLTLASMHQLEIYASLFCLEYGINPNDINIELRIYQMDEILVSIPTGDVIFNIMDKIIIFDKQIEKIKLEEE
jgi:hypothetical protein